MMDDIDQQLFEILCSHDVDIRERDQQRTLDHWPDISDIHTATRAKIRAVFEGNTDG